MACPKVLILFLFGLIATGECALKKDKQKGAYIGVFQTIAHGVAGKIWAVDDRTIYIQGFTYDGEGPDAFFWVGNSSQPEPKGLLVRYPLTNNYGRKPSPLTKFQAEDVLLRLPPGTKVTELRYLSVWCSRFTLNFGHVIFPVGIEVPKKRVLKEFQRVAHGVRSGNITILDARTFYIPNLHYDGAGPDAFFWIGKGSAPDHHGTKIPNEKGSYEVLRRYEGEDIEIQLPENKTIYDIDYLSIWCVAYRHNFGHVQIPSSDSMWLPPSLGQTKIKDEDVAKEYETGYQEEIDLQQFSEGSSKDVYLPISPNEEPNASSEPEPEPESEPDHHDLNHVHDDSHSHPHPELGSNDISALQTGDNSDSVAIHLCTSLVALMSLIVALIL